MIYTIGKLVPVVSNSPPLKSAQELVVYGKANPGEVTFASCGSDGAPHFSSELFKTMAGIDMTHVPYKGGKLAHPDLLSGRTSLMFDTFAATKPQIGANNVRALAVTTAKQFTDFIGTEMTKWAKVAKDAGIQPE